MRLTRTLGLLRITMLDAITSGVKTEPSLSFADCGITSAASSLWRRLIWRLSRKPRTCLLVVGRTLYRLYERLGASFGQSLIQGDVIVGSLKTCCCHIHHAVALCKSTTIVTHGSQPCWKSNASMTNKL